MNDSVPSDPTSQVPSTSTAPTIVVTDGQVLTGAGFLPAHEVTIRIDYDAEEVSDYLTYTADPRGELHATLPTSSAAGALRISATDHRTDSEGMCGLLWSNTETVQARGTRRGRCAQGAENARNVIGGYAKWVRARLDSA